MSKYLIITTVGTSIFTNFNKKEVKQAFDNVQHERKYKDGVRLDDLENDDAQSYDEDIYEALEKKIEKYWLKDCSKQNGKWKYIENSGSANLHASAEITSILKIAEKIKKKDKDATIEVKLLTTDTALSVSAANLICKYPFNKFGVTIQDFDPRKDYIPSLGVYPAEGQNDSQYYDEGLQQLVERFIGDKGVIKQAKKGKIKRKPALNFSGGYKAIIPILTIIAQLEDIPMYYIYEDSDYLMEVGNLPVNFDWLAIEALKPLLKNYILKEKLNVLAPLLSQEIIQFKGGMYQPKEGESQKNPVLEESPFIVHRIIHGLLSYKLLRLNKEQGFEITPLGKIICKVNTGDEKGLIMEHLLFRYFYPNEREGGLRSYQTTTYPTELPFGYKVTDANKSLIEIVDSKPKGQDYSVREIGDIDIPLKKAHTFVWAESKAYSTACDYHNKIKEDEDYYFQLKARAVSLKKYFDTVELLFIVFRFVFKDINDNHFLDSKHFKTGLKRFEELNEDEDLKSFASFRCIGITIPIDFDKDRIDFTSFYNGNFNSWVFEELKTANHA